MMKRTLNHLILAVLLAFSTPAFAADVKQADTAGQPATEQAAVTQATDIDMNNPIEKAFAKDFEMAQATPEINYVNEAYLEAWKAEMANAAAVVKKSLPHQEDGKRVDDYVAACNVLADKAFELEMLNWISDPEASITDRSFGTGATGGAMLAQARIYKQTTLNLITHYQANPDMVYAFIYNGKGADLEKLRAQ